MSKKLIVFGFWTNSNNELATNGLITQSTTSFLLLAKNLNKSKHNKHRKISFVLIEHFSLHFANIFFFTKKEADLKTKDHPEKQKKINYTGISYYFYTQKDHEHASHSYLHISLTQEELMKNWKGNKLSIPSWFLKE